jgi:D-sedoheptulose 7-phosphate isomerase
MADHDHARAFVGETIQILGSIPIADIDAVVAVVADTKARGGRIFFCGSGGGAGHASHAACDFRKLAGIEAYSVTDNVSELTARVNDDGWDDAYADWLRVSRIDETDCVFVFSVGGGSVEPAVSVNLVNAMRVAKEVGSSIVGIVGRDGGTLKQWSDACIVVPVVDPANVTAQTEGLQSLFWHLIATHPALAPATPRWESLV